MEENINIFDFDGTLTTETWPKFWVWVEKFGYRGEERNDELEAALAKYRESHEGNSLETFFGFFHDLLHDNKEVLTKEELMMGEKYIQYNPGMSDYLKSSTSKDYIVSGGLTEFLKNLEVADKFQDIYGSHVEWNSDGYISGIGEIMTDDKKIRAIQDILKKNGREIEDCWNVYFVGDGYSDAPAMRYVHNHGGKAIFVHQPDEEDGLFEHNQKIYKMLEEEGIVDFCLVADYRDGSELSNILKREKRK